MYSANVVRVLVYSVVFYGVVLLAKLVHLHTLYRIDFEPPLS